jgi:hypothetical protein
MCVLSEKLAGLLCATRNCVTVLFASPLCATRNQEAALGQILDNQLEV